MAEVTDLQFLPIEEPNDGSPETLTLDPSPQLLPDVLPSSRRRICPYYSDLVVVEQDLVDHQGLLDLFPESDEMDPDDLGLGLDLDLDQAPVFEPDPHSDAQIVAVGDGSDGGRGLSLCWDCLHVDSNEEFEWEEVEEERETLNMMDDELSHVDFEQEDEITRNVGWEVLLSVSNLGRSYDAESDIVDDHDAFLYFADHDGSLKGGGPPAARWAVENLATVVLRDGNGDSCAVCKGEIFMKERVRKLPCSHHYHEDCIFPWLGIRNTCPLCRFELPTDDPEYERSKGRRVAGGIIEEESWVRYDYEILHEE